MAYFHGKSGILEFLHHLAPCKISQVSALFTIAAVCGILLGQGCKVLAGLKLFLDLYGLLLGVHQNVAGLYLFLFAEVFLVNFKVRFHFIFFNLYLGPQQLFDSNICSESLLYIIQRSAVHFKKLLKSFAAAVLLCDFINFLVQIIIGDLNILLFCLKFNYFVSDQCVQGRIAVFLYQILVQLIFRDFFIVHPGHHFAGCLAAAS